MSLAMTERYSHLIPDMKREAVAGIAKLMEMNAGEPPKREVVPGKDSMISGTRTHREDQRSV